MYRWKIFSCTILAVALLVRFIVLPEFLRSHFNNAEAPDGSRFHIGDISISLTSASFDLHDVSLTNSEDNPLFNASRIHIGLDIAALKMGHWVSRIEVHEPVLEVTTGLMHTSFQLARSSWLQTISLLPINKISITDGTAKFSRGNETPDPILIITDITLRMRNLENVVTNTRRLPTTGRATGRIEEATVFLDLEVDSKAASPTFNISARVSDLNLFDVQKYLSGIGIHEAPQGLLTIYTEAGSMKNRVIGFVKQELETVVSVASRELAGFPGKPVIKALDERYFQRELIQTDADVWSAIGRTLHGAFIQSVNTLLQENSGPPAIRKSAPHGKPKRKTSLVSNPTTINDLTIQSGC